MWKLKTKRLDTVCSVCTSGVSVVCMSSMGAAVAAAGTAGSAGAIGMAGMELSSSGASTLSLLPRLFDRLGLGFLNQLPDAVAQPLLVVLLTISAIAAYLAYRGHRQPYGLVLTLASGAAMYISIYHWMSELLYFVSLAGLVAAGVWSIFLARRPPPVHQAG